MESTTLRGRASLIPLDGQSGCSGECAQHCRVITILEET
jgi:hypothetical protein